VARDRPRYLGLTPQALRRRRSRGSGEAIAAMPIRLFPVRGFPRLPEPRTGRGHTAWGASPRWGPWHPVGLGSWGSRPRLYDAAPYRAEPEPSPRAQENSQRPSPALRASSPGGRGFTYNSLSRRERVGVRAAWSPSFIEESLAFPGANPVGCVKRTSFCMHEQLVRFTHPTRSRALVRGVLRLPEPRTGRRRTAWGASPRWGRWHPIGLGSWGSRPRLYAAAARAAQTKQIP
jgi:hypothetical protein